MILPTTKVERLSSVGRTTAGRLERIGIKTADDLLWNIPRSYENISEVIKISNLQPGTKATIKARIETIHSKQTARRHLKMTEAVVADDTDQIKIVWFNQPYIAQSLKTGVELYFAGEIRLNNYGQFQLNNPTYERISADTTNTARIVPLYHLTAGLTQKQMRFLIKQVLPLTQTLTDYLPEKIKQKYNLIPLAEALNHIHFPDSLTDFQTAQFRLKFDELFFTILSVQMAKRDLLSHQAPKINFQSDIIQNLVKHLPFTLTNDQKKVAWRILQDIDSDQPANRLIQGDVGSGKTIVAGISLLNTIKNNLQSILLAPTEILAWQHWQTFCEIFQTETFLLLTRSYKFLHEPAQEPRTITKAEANKLINTKKDLLVIGTHALLHDKINWLNIGLIVVDEQHRFGVAQRQQLKDKTPNLIPHFISMTATPIPRSLSLTLYGDLDISVIKEKPTNRRDIITRIVDKKNKNQEYDFIKSELDKDNQAFVVCPLIEESDKLGVAAAEKVYKDLQKNVFADYSIALIHGKLNKQAKEKIMNDFRAKKINILIATAVIEVGVDIPDATVMLIEGVERFGLAQLHQLRGRVGRSHKQSYCLLSTDNLSPQVRDRLNILVKHNSGFAIAEADLKMRGPGDLYGFKQSGLPLLNIASLSDVEIMEQAREAVAEILKIDASLIKYPKIKNKLADNQPIHFE